MAAPKGNEFWKARSSHGRKALWEDPEQLRDACYQYVEWVHEHPLEEAVTYQGEVMETPVPKMRAMSLTGLQIFLGTNAETWSQYRSKKDFAEVVKEIEAIIRTQKFEGASAGMLNPNIIARDLGLADKKELTGEDGGPIKTQDVSITEAARRIAFVLASGAQGNDESGEKH